MRGRDGWAGVDGSWMAGCEKLCAPPAAANDLECLSSVSNENRFLLIGFSDNAAVRNRRRRLRRQCQTKCAEEVAVTYRYQNVAKIRINPNAAPSAPPSTGRSPEALSFSLVSV